MLGFFDVLATKHQKFRPTPCAAGVQGGVECGNSGGSHAGLSVTLLTALEQAVGAETPARREVNQRPPHIVQSERLIQSCDSPMLLVLGERCARACAAVRGSRPSLKARTPAEIRASGSRPGSRRTGTNHTSRADLKSQTHRPHITQPRGDLARNERAAAKNIHIINRRLSAAAHPAPSAHKRQPVAVSPDPVH